MKSVSLVAVNHPLQVRDLSLEPLTWVTTATRMSAVDQAHAVKVFLQCFYVELLNDHEARVRLLNPSGTATFEAKSITATIYGADSLILGFAQPFLSLEAAVQNLLDWATVHVTFENQGFCLTPPAVASTSPEASSIRSVLKDALPGLRTRVQCPECDFHSFLDAVIIHLNDRHRWTREALADWLDALPVDLNFSIPKERDIVH